MNQIRYYIVGIAALLGMLIIAQTKAFENVTDELMRDAQSNVFQELEILKNKNSSLESEVAELEERLEQLTDQDSALDAIDKEINKYKMLSGKHPVFGPGIMVKINREISASAIIDLVNQLFTAGAEAVSVNGIRLANHTGGFDVLPQGDILLNGSILSLPYEFQAIGESSTLKGVLESPGGIIDRIKAGFEGLEVTVQAMDVIRML